MGQISCARAIILRDEHILLIKRNKFGSKYFTLPGGHVDPGETREAAVRREVLEETSLIVTSVQYVFFEPARNGFLPQHIYLCEVAPGEVSLRIDSEEAALNAIGQNTYHPGWYSLDVLLSESFRTQALGRAITESLKNGWPASVVELTAD